MKLSCCFSRRVVLRGRTPRGVRGLKFVTSIFLDAGGPSRTPRGVRGLKYKSIPEEFTYQESHPARGARIEMCAVLPYLSAGYCRTPRGVRGLKYVDMNHATATRCRTPRGVRGLKCSFSCCSPGPTVSHPARGARIEMATLHAFAYSAFCRTPRGVRGLKFPTIDSRGSRNQVAPREGCAD